ncbi:MAG: hypothetical protein SVV03_03575 [Candidatus Nanohaloarchaea archaeon]|nr:hypothetical protein [Candidatus Nanohaloarchaea archaeon]
MMELLGDAVDWFKRKDFESEIGLPERLSAANPSYESEINWFLSKKIDEEVLDAYRVDTDSSLVLLDEKSSSDITKGRILVPVEDSNFSPSKSGRSWILEYSPTGNLYSLVAKRELYDGVFDFARLGSNPSFNVEEDVYEILGAEYEGVVAVPDNSSVEAKLRVVHEPNSGFDWGGFRYKNSPKMTGRLLKYGDDKLFEEIENRLLEE